LNYPPITDIFSSSARIAAMKIGSSNSCQVLVEQTLPRSARIAESRICRCRESAGRLFALTFSLFSCSSNPRLSFELYYLYILECLRFIGNVRREHDGDDFVLRGTRSHVLPNHEAGRHALQHIYLLSITRERSWPPCPSTYLFTTIHYTNNKSSRNYCCTNNDTTQV
jgi:hypothetical protein